MVKYLLFEMCEVQKKLKRSMATGNISPGERENILVIAQIYFFNSLSSDNYWTLVRYGIAYSFVFVAMCIETILSCSWVLSWHFKQFNHMYINFIGT